MVHLYIPRPAYKLQSNNLESPFSFHRSEVVGRFKVFLSMSTTKRKGTWCSYPAEMKMVGTFLLLSVTLFV